MIIQIKKSRDKKKCYKCKKVIKKGRLYGCANRTVKQENYCLHCAVRISRFSFNELRY